MRPRLVVLPCLLLLVTLLPAAAPHASSATAFPALRVGVVARGLDHPWEVRALPGGNLLVTQRARRTLTLVVPSTGGKRTVPFSTSRVLSRGETGLMGLAIDPAFVHNRRIYTCSGWLRAGGGADVRVVAWTLDSRLTRATYQRTLVGGIPFSRDGRHGGCRLMITREGSLLVGTGDATIGRAPQSLATYAGKVLRVNRMTGRPWPGNRWYGGTGRKRSIYTYGHRNVQGLAQRPGGSLWSVEHGTDRDDEVNLLGAGRNYGWNPVPGYNERRPMTDPRLPGPQYGARWRSGFPTIAPSGAAFVTGSRWGPYRGSLAVAVLKGERLMFVQLSSAGRVRWVRAPSELRRYGRLRAVTAVDQSLFVTTDNGDGRDVVLRVMPAS